ncbi:hypothetical protein [Streptomyces sp. NPDC054887]
MIRLLAGGPHGIIQPARYYPLPLKTLTRPRRDDSCNSLRRGVTEPATQRLVERRTTGATE